MKIEKREKYPDKKEGFKKILLWFTSKLCCCIPEFKTNFGATYAKFDAYNEANSYLKIKWEIPKKNW